MLTPDIAVELVVNALRVATILVLVMIVPSMIVGLLVSLFQAATQLNEQTLSFLPRLLVTLSVLALMGHRLAQYLMDYCLEVFQQAATLIG
ncbi:flagellar biosynthetic protein FliQ [Chromobacterium haemolyticum]|uniref:flagellar biosynthetic protein FliQ n=1 Tax=Chromobacterium haemolyticum TaxID=394935 RepID=UPI0009DB56B4|nr:flagellar biosynthetic protein FliQ [Chromobacterium haemolyticum]OQS33886.1 flagellar biosynthetic protein FliQ [Chromobacterium haemolyticum]